MASPIVPDLLSRQRRCRVFAVDDCKAFVGCFLPVLEELLASGQPKK